jgi:hypothetical protein
MPRLPLRIKLIIPIIFEVVVVVCWLLVVSCWLTRGLEPIVLTALATAITIKQITNNKQQITNNKQQTTNNQVLNLIVRAIPVNKPFYTNFNGRIRFEANIPH